jgi:hypothetical protein
LCFNKRQTTDDSVIEYALSVSMGN